MNKASELITAQTDKNPPTKMIQPLFRPSANNVSNGPPIRRTPRIFYLQDPNKLEQLNASNHNNRRLISLPRKVDYGNQDLRDDAATDKGSGDIKKNSRQYASKTDKQLKQQMEPNKSLKTISSREQDCQPLSIANTGSKCNLECKEAKSNSTFKDDYSSPVHKKARFEKSPISVQTREDSLNTPSATGSGQTNKHLKGDISDNPLRESFQHGINTYGSENVSRLYVLESNCVTAEKVSNGVEDKLSKTYLKPQLGKQRNVQDTRIRNKKKHVPRKDNRYVKKSRSVCRRKNQTENTVCNKSSRNRPRQPQTRQRKYAQPHHKVYIGIPDSKQHSCPPTESDKLQGNVKIIFNSTNGDTFEGSLSSKDKEPIKRVVTYCIDRDGNARKVKHIENASRPVNSTDGPCQFIKGVLGWLGFTGEPLKEVNSKPPVMSSPKRNKQMAKERGKSSVKADPKTNIIRNARKLLFLAMENELRAKQGYPLRQQASSS